MAGDWILVGTKHVFSGMSSRGKPKTSRSAALKAARRGYTHIALHQAGTDRYRWFLGRRWKVAPTGPWGSKWVGNVKHLSPRYALFVKSMKRSMKELSAQHRTGLIKKPKVSSGGGGVMKRKQPKRKMSKRKQPKRKAGGKKKKCKCPKKKK